VPVAETPKTEPPVVSSQLGSDDLLRDIYSRETGAHVATVRGYLERERSAPSPHTLTEDVYRACHTLSGSSKMAEARHGIRLAEPLDHWLRKSFNSGVGLDDTDLMLLSDCMAAMESVATHLDESTGYFLAHDGLRERIVDSESRLDARIAEAARLAAESAAASETRAVAALAEPQIEELPGVGAVEIVPAEAITLESPEPVGFESSTVESVTLSEDSVQHEQGESEHVESVVLEASTFRPAAPPPEDDDEAPVYHTDFDPEVASIFTEEATELIDVSEHALNDWRADPENAELRSALKRPMHTLKGGARMAGIVPMGDLSHEIETLVMQVDNGAVPANEGMFSVLQSCLDELARMRESVAASQPVAHARRHIARIHALSGKGAPVAEAQPAKEKKAPEPSAPEARPLEAAIIPAIPALPPGGAVDGMALSTPAPAIVAELSAPSPAEPAPPAPVMERKEDEAVVPFVERRSATAIAARAVFPAQRAEGSEDHLTPPAPVPPGREPVAPSSDRPEMARVDAELLDTLLNTAGEVSIARARLEQQMGSIDFNLAELGRTVTRLKEQLRKLEIETEAQILHRHEEDAGSHRSDFDPLELDRYSSIQQFSRALAETANDVQSIQGLLDTLAQDTQNLLQQQARTITELQNGLMRTRMVPFQRHVQRLARIVRQAAADTGKRAELVIEGAAGELDRQVLERMLPPFEHMLRNSVVHGIEKPDERVAAGKTDTGRIKLELHREGAEVMVRLSDDGAGMNLKAIRDKGHALGLIPEGQTLSDEDAMQLILEPGFSTAGTITQQAGRGVGMDVVATEIKRLGGALHMETHAGQGTQFTIRLPFTLAISHALVVRTGEEYYALPLPTVEGVLRLSKTEVASHLGRDQATFDYNGQKYRFQNLALFVGLEPSPLPEQDVTIPVVLVRAGEHSTGLIADELVGSREIVVKSVGPQVSSIRGISGATILGDGRIVVILDIGALVRAEWRGRAQPVQREKTDRRTFVMVVDDSITVRRVTQRLLERNGMRVITARDGLDAVGLLQDHVPDIILLDIEMPRMDGYEVAAHVRNDPRLANVPIIMITSRVGEKHRARAIELGVNDYLGKPYQEAQLLDAIAPLVERHRMTQTGRRLAELEARG
jgi:chemosensory pili system protein ChpA (sensor histidine kinase/response regulator)